MVDPTTVNRSLFIPTRGSDPGTWDTPLNTNFSGLDTMLGAPNTISTTGGATVLNSTQLAFGTIFVTGTLVADAFVQFPAVGGWWSIYNGCTVGNFALFVQSGTNLVQIGIPPGEIVDILINGNTPLYRNLGRVNALEHWIGIGSIPRWVSLSTVPPYLLANGQTFNIATYPISGQRFGTAFGGNGVSTSAVPDLRGRFHMDYDATGARITAAQCGINGTTMGAALDAQSIQLSQAQMPSHFHTAGIYDPSHSHGTNGTGLGFSSTGGGGFQICGYGANTISASVTGVRVNSSNGLDTVNSTGGNATHNNMPNMQITGVSVVRVA